MPFGGEAGMGVFCKEAYIPFLDDILSPNSDQLIIVTPNVRLRDSRTFTEFQEEKSYDSSCHEQVQVYHACRNVAPQL